MVPSYWPVGLDVRDRGVLVVGWNAEALAKVRRLLDYGARVTVVTPSAVPELAAMVPRITWLPRRYRPGDLASARLVIVTDPAEAEALLLEARQRGVLVYVPDEPSLSDFIAMAAFRRGPVEVAVHTNGASAALSKILRDRLEEAVPEAVGDLANALGEMRPWVRRCLLSWPERRRFWHAAVQDGLRDIRRDQFNPTDFRDRLIARLRDVVAQGGAEDGAGRARHEPA